MILAVDVGNSNIVAAVMEQDKILSECRIVTDPARTAEKYREDLEKFLSGNGTDPTALDGAIISSVVPKVEDALAVVIGELTGKKVLTVGPELKTGLTVSIDDPSEIGADLVVGSVAVLQEHKLPVIVIDMGTATTVMALDKSGAFIGGCIAPGVRISMDALTGNTALLPELKLDPPKRAIGRNTVDCMRSGILMGAACMLDGMVQRMEEELGSKATVVATGGIAQFVVPMCRTPMVYDKDLLLKGLAVLYRMNR